ncbi:GmrSD restriction endonuclease domain-containing protein [Paraburkholderia sp. MM5482-R1]|uniref:GmrSD restriction endonuclease domain-containing protein n=1 Tax=unclassified Paraburkholderia TaxID=2615204 RepID=UPI003D23E156
MIPVFQRGYVWALEKQVAPLWADLEDRALKLIERGEESTKVPVYALKPLQKHFLGSVVLTPVTGTFGRVACPRRMNFEPPRRSSFEPGWRPV